MTCKTVQATRRYTFFPFAISSTRLPRWPARALVLTCEASPFKGRVLYIDQSWWELISWGDSRAEPRGDGGRALCWSTFPTASRVVPLSPKTCSQVWTLDPLPQQFVKQGWIVISTMLVHEHDMSIYFITLSIKWRLKWNIRVLYIKKIHFVLKCSCFVACTSPRLEVIHSVKENLVQAWKCAESPELLLSICFIVHKSRRLDVNLGFNEECKQATLAEVKDKCWDVSSGLIRIPLNGFLQIKICMLRLFLFCWN